MSVERTPERIAACKMHSKKLYHERSEWGVCVMCGKPKRSGETTKICIDCLKTRREYRERNHEKLLQRQRERVAKLRAAGLCVYCGKPTENGLYRCEKHKKYYTEINKKYAEQRRQARKKAAYAKWKTAEDTNT